MLRKIYKHFLFTLMLCSIFYASLVKAQEYVPGEVIVKLKGGVAGATTSASSFQKTSSDKGMHLKGSWKSLNMQHYRLKAGADVMSSIHELEQDPNVEYAEPNYILHKSDVESYGMQGDPVSQSDFEALVDNNGDGTQDNFDQTTAPIQVREAWNFMVSQSASNRPIVAVIDTGLDMNHKAFRNWCATWTNDIEVNGQAGVDDDGNGFIDDYNGWNFVSNNNNPFDDDGHGTHVAGIILGTNQEIEADPLIMPVGGVCNPLYRSKIRIMPVKFLDSNGSGTTADAIKAVYYAVNKGAKILNNSWGGGSYSHALHEAIAYSYSNNTLFVAAAGNSASNNDSYAQFPANYDVPNVLSVASTTSSDVLSGFSNYGKSTVHLAAPGSYIWSTYTSAQGNELNLYALMSGTSMATPFVSGAAAMISRLKPTMTGYQIKDILMESINTKASLSNYVATGGRLNVYNAAVLASGSSIESQPSYNISLSSQDRGLASAAASGGAGCGLVKSMSGGDGGGGWGGNAFGFALLLFAPILLVRLFRTKDNRRKYERYEVHSQMKIKVGGKELRGSMETISLGGLAFDAGELLEKGSVVSMKLILPDGSQEVEVKGKIVWTEGNHHGVQFEKQKEGIFQFIQQTLGIKVGAS